MSERTLPPSTISIGRPPGAMSSFFTMVDGFVDYYGVSEPCFREYLATLGLRDSQGIDKGAYTTLKTEAEKRGF